MNASLPSFAKGMTLMEALIVVAILGILSLIAMPAYQDHITKGRRTDAQIQLMEIKSLQERWRMTNASYASLAELGGWPDSEYYSFSVSNNSASTYRLTATAKGSQASNDPDCKVLSVDQSDTKSPGGDCWRH